LKIHTWYVIRVRNVEKKIIIFFPRRLRDELDS
jgi:hypothetical protein